MSSLHPRFDNSLSQCWSDAPGLSPMIACPAKSRDYAALEIERGDLVGNVMRARRFDCAYWLSRLGR